MQVEKPNSAAAVVPTLMAVTLPGPSRAVRVSLARLDTTVPAEMIMEIMPAQDRPAPKPRYMLGQAAPSRASGRPRLIKAK